MLTCTQMITFAYGDQSGHNTIVALPFLHSDGVNIRPYQIHQIRHKLVSTFQRTDVFFFTAICCTCRSKAILLLGPSVFRDRMLSRNNQTFSPSTVYYSAAVNLYKYNISKIQGKWHANISERV